MLASVWLTIAGIVLFAWYTLWKKPLHHALGIDPFRATPGDRTGRELPVWLLFAAQVALLVGMAPLYSAAMLVRYGILPAVLWTALGAMLISALPNMAMLWASIRSGGKSVGSLMYLYLGGRGKQALCVLGWLVAVLMVAMMAGALSSALDDRVQPLSPEDYIADAAALQDARKNAERGQPLDLQPYMDDAAYEQAQRSVSWEAGQRTFSATAAVGLLLVSVFYGFALFRWRRFPALSTLGAVVLMALMVWLGQRMPLSMSQNRWAYLILGYAMFSALMPMRWLSTPRDALVGLLALGMAVLCAIAALFSPIKITQPAFVAWNLQRGGSLLPFLFMTTLAGGANTVYLLSTSQRTALHTAREHQAYPVTFGGTLAAAFIGILSLVAVGQYTNLPLSALQDVFTAPRLLMGSMADLLTKVGLPLQWAVQWVSLVYIGCALGALDTAVRLGTMLLHSIYFHQNTLPRSFSPDRMLAAFITTVAALLLSNVSYWDLWPLFGSVSMGLCAVALLPVIMWVQQAGRKIWMLVGPAALLAGLSLWTLGSSVLAQIQPRNDQLLSSSTGTLFLQAVVAILLLGTMAHAVSGMHQPPRELPPSMEASLDE